MLAPVVLGLWHNKHLAAHRQQVLAALAAHGALHAVAAAAPALVGPPANDLKHWAEADPPALQAAAPETSFDDSLCQLAAAAEVAVQGGWLVQHEQHS